MGFDPSLSSASCFSDELTPVSTSSTGLVFLILGVALGLGLLDCDLISVEASEGVFFTVLNFLEVGIGGGGGTGILDACCTSLFIH